MHGNDPLNPLAAIPVYEAANAVAGLKPVTGAGMVSGLVAKASPGASYGAVAGLPSGTSAGWLVGYNAVAVPADGAVNPALVVEAAPFAAGLGQAVLSNTTIPTTYTIGCVYFLTSGASPYANKASSGVSAFMSAKVV